MTDTTDRADDPQWLEWRRGGITASDIARAASGRYGGGYAVIAEKLGRVAAQPYNPRMARGHQLESQVTTAAEALMGLHIVGEQTQVQHQDRPEWRATLDGLAAAVAAPTLDDCTHVVEVKTRGVDVRPAWDYWRPQTEWQRLVCGIDRTLLVEAIVDDRPDGPVVVGLRLHEQEADPLAQIELIDIAEHLWGHLQAGTLPDPDAAALPMVKEMHTAVDPSAEVVDLTHLADDIARFATIKAAIKASEAERDAIEARLRAAVGDATKGRADGWEVGVSKPRRTLTTAGEARILTERPDLGRTVLDRTRAKAEARDLYDAATEPVGARVLTIKERTDG